MSVGVALVGWALAVIAVAIAAGAELRRSRRLETVARAAHELRGPITAARLGVGLGVRRGALAALPLRAVELELERAALALKDFESATGGCPAQPRHQDVDLVGLLADCTEAWRPAADARRGCIHVNCPGDAAVVHGDRLRLAQALDNLIANAIEHGGGAVQVCVRVDLGSVRVEVTDGGPGLPAPVAELSRRARRGRGSRGRGLAIAAAVAHEHGGRVASAPSDRGARLLLELPLADGHGQPGRRPGS
ncbi:MAG: sensor histidine kinase [Solirubrobacteraceae bacterium]